MTTKRPNFLLFLTDDHGAWATRYAGNREIHTPVLDQLVQQGVRCINAFAPTPVCSPARASLLTGLNPSQVGIHDWLQEADPAIANRDWLDGIPTLFDFFHSAGYATCLSGKWHLGRSHLPPSGCDDHFGLPHWQGAHNTRYTYIRNGAFVELDGNKSAHITNHALAFLDNVPADRPFFLNVGYIATHSPYAQQHHDSARTAPYIQATFDDIPPYNSHPWCKNEGGPGESPPLGPLRDRYIGYYAAVSEIDENVGRILDRLERLGRLEDTIVVYTSDHGCALGHHGFWGKGNSTRPLNMYETSLRIPLIWSGVGLPSGHTVTQCVDHHDTFQTLLELARIEPEPTGTYPGRSYASHLHGEPGAWDDTRFGEYGDLRMIRTPAWKLVWRYPHGPHDLFDLVQDPGETVNLAEDPRHAARLAELKTAIDRFFAVHEDPHKSGLNVKQIPRHNLDAEAWRDGRREARGLQCG